MQGVLTMKRLFLYHNILKDRDADPWKRFSASVHLTMFFKGESDIRPKLLHIKRLLMDASLQERIWDDTTIVGQNIYDWFTPSKLGEHIIWFTTLFSLLLIGVYSYMCADWRNYREESYGPHVGSALGESFDFAFLSTWKGFNSLAVRDGDSIRWFASILEHQGLQHIVSNLCVFLLVAGELEHKYGTTRIIIISFASGVGGNLFSAVAENGCGIVVGASGLIFGLIGFWVADLLINFHFAKQVAMKVLLAGVFFVLFIITVFTQSHVSNWSHLGGFLSGLFLTMLFLPRLGKQRLEATFMYVGIVGTILYFTILPIIAYKVVFPSIQCSDIGSDS